MYREDVQGNSTEGRILLSVLLLTKFLRRLITLRSVRIVAVCAVALLATAFGVNARLNQTPPKSPTVTTQAQNTTDCATGGSTCLATHDLLANSLARAVSVALRPIPTVAPQAQQQTTATDQAPNTVGQPCHDSYMFVPNISQWTTPPGCYANIFTPDRTQYSAPSTFGYCNWWVEALHPNQQDILYGTEYARSTTPIVGSAMWFPPNEQGASSAGHWAQVVAIGPDHYWLLITEMNFGWRGGGFGKVDYRYVHVDPGAGIFYIH